MFEQDYIMRMIHDMVRVSLAMLGFGKKGRPSYSPDQQQEEIFQSLKLPLKEELQRLIALQDFNQAENRLFEALSPGDQEAFSLALWFYDTLSRLPDSAFAIGSYSREEIPEGLQDAAEIYGIDRTLLAQYTPAD